MERLPSREGHAMINKSRGTQTDANGAQMDINWFMKGSQSVLFWYVFGAVLSEKRGKNLYYN